MFTSTTWEKSYAHSPWFKRWQHHPNALVKPQMMPLQNTAPYNVWHHDDQGSSTSTQTICLIVWGERHLTVQANSAALLESQKPKIVTDQTLWCWTTRQVQTESYGISDRCFTTRQKSQAIFKQEANAQDPNTYALPLKACHMAFCCCFQPPSTASSTEERVSGKSSWISCKEGKPWVYHFLLFIPNHCTSSNIFYI